MTDVSLVTGAGELSDFEIYSPCLLYSSQTNNRPHFQLPYIAQGNIM